MSTDPHSDNLDPSSDASGEAPAMAGGSVGGDQDGWQAPDSGTFSGASPYPSQGSPQSGYGNYQTPPVGQPGSAPGYPPPPAGGQPGYGPGGGYGPGNPGSGGYGPGYTPYPGSAGYTPYPGSAGYTDYTGYSSVIAPKPAIIPLRPLSIGEILGGAFESLRANPKAMFVPSLVVMSIMGLISAGGFAFFFSRLSLPGVTTSEELTDAEIEANLDKLWSSIAGLVVQTGLTSVLTVFAASILTGLLIVTVSRTILGRKASLSDVWQRTKPRVGALIGQVIIIQIILGVATVVFIAIGVGVFWLPMSSVIANGGDDGSAGLIVLTIIGLVVATLAFMLGLFALGCKLCLAPAALILENIGVFEGISRSWALTRGYFWRVVGVRLLSTIIISVVSWAASSALNFVTQGLALMAPNAMLAVLAGSVLVSSLIQAVTMPFDSAVVALIYTDLRMRSEGLDVELRRAAGV